MSISIASAVVAPVSHLQSLPAQSIMRKSLISNSLFLSPECVPILSLSSPPRYCFNFCRRKVECSPRKFAISRRISKGIPPFTVRAEQKDDGGSVSTVNPGESSQEEPVNAHSSMAGKSLLSKWGQSVNLAGIAFSSKVIFKERHLAIPHVSVPDITWIDWKALRAKGFEAVLFDKDNTLTAPYGQNVWPTLLNSLEECRTAFDGRVALLSNSAGLYQFDPEGTDAKAVEDKLGISVIRHGSKKPSGDAQAVAKHFGCDPSLVVMVGDRYFTDIVYGNSNGLLTIRPAPLTSNGEPFVVKRVRALEDTLVEWWQNQGVKPSKHPLFEHPVDFIKDPGFW